MIKFKAAVENLLSTGNQFADVFLDNENNPNLENGAATYNVRCTMFWIVEGFRKISKNSPMAVNQRGWLSRLSPISYYYEYPEDKNDCIAEFHDLDYEIRLQKTESKPTKTHQNLRYRR